MTYCRVASNAAGLSRLPSLTTKTSERRRLSWSCSALAKSSKTSLASCTIATMHLAQIPICLVRNARFWWMLPLIGCKYTPRTSSGALTNGWLPKCNFHGSRVTSAGLSMNVPHKSRRNLHRTGGDFPLEQVFVQSNWRCFSGAC